MSLRPPVGPNSPLLEFEPIIATDYGVYGDGTSDDTVALAAAVTAASGRTLKLPRGTYKVTSGITLSDGIKLDLTDGAVINFSTAPTSTILFSGVGTEATAVNLSGNAVAGATSLTVAAGAEAGFAAGNYVKVGSTATYDPGRTNQAIGEIAVVSSTSSGTINLKSPLAGGDYNTADTATVAKITPLSGIQLFGGKIIGGGTGSQHVGIRVDKGANIRVEGTVFQSVEDQAASFYDCVDVVVHAISVTGSNYSGRGYGVFFAWCCQDATVSDSFFSDCRHAATTGGGASRKGLARRVTYIGNHVLDSASTGDALDTHAGCEDISFIGNTIYDSSNTGIQSEGPRAVVIGNVIYSTASHGIYLHNETTQPTEYICHGNIVRSAGVSGIRYSNGTTVGAGAIVRFVTITGNGIYNSASGGSGIYVVSTDTWRITNATIANNSIYGAQGANNILLQKADGCAVTGNSMSAGTNTAQYGVRISDVTKTAVSGNAVSFPAVGTTRGIGCLSAVDCTITGNTVSTAANGVLTDSASNNCNVSGNNTRGCSTPVNPSTGVGHVFSGNSSQQAMQTLATNAVFTLTPWTSPERTLHTGTLTANRAVTLSTTNAVTGMRFKITRTGGGAFTLDVGAGPLKSLATGQWATVEYDGSAWFLAEFGSL